jgi:3-oxoacyl-[acyl-carrier protein] reductase
MIRLDGKTALITGAGRGLGEGVARTMAAQGCAVMLIARDGAAVQAVAREIVAAGGRAEAMACDVSDYAAVERVVAATKQKLVGLDILVNNAGVIEPIAELASSDPKLWARNVEINVIGAYYVVRAVLEGMLKTGGGTIVNVSSGAAYRPLEGWSAYCSGKAGLAMMTRAIALETQGKGKIRASGVNMISQIPRANLSPVEHAVRGLLYLCDPAADDLIGQDASTRDEAFRKRVGLPV